MNKAFCGKKIFFSLLLTGCLIFFNFSCGLDTFYVIDGPTNVVHQPDCSSIDYSESYFEFYTVDKDYDSIKFLGTDVYYKIYSSESRLKTEAESLQAAANKEDSNSSAAYSMIQSYKFQPLRGAGHSNVNVLIPTVGNNERIFIRLSDYNNIYLAQITVDGDNIYNDSSRVIPVRSLPDRPGFNFRELRTSNPSLLPKSDDSDYNSNGSSSDSNFYVCMFALAIGQDSSYSPVYSNILYLGSVRIPSE